MTLVLIHQTGTGEVQHVVMEVNQDLELHITQTECPYYNVFQKNCMSEEILQIDYPKLIRLLEDRGLKPRPAK